MLLLRGKNQGMIEFADLSSAQCMVSYWSAGSHATPPTVRGRTVYCQFSNHQQLKPASGGAGGGGASENGPAVAAFGASGGSPFSSANGGGSSHSMQHSGMSDVVSNSEASSVLRVVVDQVTALLMPLMSPSSLSLTLTLIPCTNSQSHHTPTAAVRRHAGQLLPAVLALRKGGQDRDLPQERRHAGTDPVRGRSRSRCGAPLAGRDVHVRVRSV